MRRILIGASLVFAAAGCLSAAGAQPERAPLDAGAAIAELRRAYHRRPFVESLELTVEGRGERRRESITVRASQKGELRLDLGDLCVWTDGPALRAVHRLNAGTYFEAALGEGDRSAALIAALPPLPVPQIGLVLQPRSAPASEWRPAPACPELRWVSAVAASHGKKPAVVLDAVGDQCTLVVAAVGSTPVLTYAQAKIVLEGAPTTLTARIERLDEPVGRLDADLRGRERVHSLSDLVARSPDVRPGLAMPELIAEPLRRSERRGAKLMIGPAKPCIYVLFVPGDEAAEVFTRESWAAAGRAGVPGRLVAVCALADAGQRERGADVMSRLEADAGYLSYSARTTIERFADHGAKAAAVIVGGDGIVRGVVPLGAAQPDSGAPAGDAERAPRHAIERVKAALEEAVGAKP